MTEINFLNIIQVLVAIALIGFILIQRGPGATAGSAFGGGASGTVFGAKGSGSFLTKSTAILATLFFIITMLIAIDASETFSSIDSSGEQDLGVFGALEDVEPTVTPVDDAEINTGDALGDIIEDTQEQAADAANAVESAAGEAVDAVEQQVEQAVEETEKATDSEDSDGNNN
ncbi:preprotein translocase subunit SecG [Marinicella sp. S1101]|uniref:preprotein translocase subunit SecG n=1 Tax=Marinicella marina TaxID=2996016 RepID=UPI0022609D40|nr:preprotein translocase subunit SecG [Marinicella marina]MCX7554110.1 preprotein translocase subunit SecG [Marinicella marina]MDJ1141197.1 preprotein translocase subunit SecG [Marinicella marina]